MGANGSTQDTYEEDDESVTVMKGVRLTPSVINRMRGVSTPVFPQSPPIQPVAPSLSPSASLEPDPLSLPPPPPSVEHVSSSPPPFVEPLPLPPFTVEPAPFSSPLPPSVEPVPLPLSTVESVALPSTPSAEPVPLPPSPPTVESAPISPPPPLSSAEPLPLPIFNAESVPLPLPPPPLSVESVSLSPPSAEHVPPTPPPPTEETVPLPLFPPSVEPMALASHPAVDEEELRGKTTEELQEGLGQERSQTEQELPQRVEEEKLQTQVQDEVGKLLEEETLKQAMLKDRSSSEDHRLRAQLYAQQLEEREKKLRKQDALYREEVAKLEERGKAFYKVTTENYHSASREVKAKFRRYEINPVCADLQNQILTCYRENPGQTLSCSGIASLYLQCVSDARQNKTETGG